MDGGLQDMRAGSAVARQTDTHCARNAVVHHHGQLVLRPGQRQPQPVISRQHGAARQLVQQGEQLLIAEPLHITRFPGRPSPVSLRQGLPWFQKGHGPRAFASNMVQQRKIVLARHLKLLGNQASHLPLGQQTGKEWPGLVIAKGLSLQRQRLR